MNQQIKGRHRAGSPARGSRAIYRSRLYDLYNCHVSLRQWRILQAVIDSGGFAEAAKVLHLSQSTVSYTVSKLQDRIGWRVIRMEGRKPTLNTDGKALLARTRRLLRDAIELEIFADSLRHGWGGEVKLVVDQDFPSSILMRALDAFTKRGGGATYASVMELAALNPEECLREQSADLAISDRVPQGFLGEPLIEIEYLPVVHACHPLQQLGRTVSAEDLAQYTQIGIGYAADRHRCPKCQTQQLRRWSVTSLDTAMEAVRNGLGFAWLPAHRVQKLIENGTLGCLSIEGISSQKTYFYLIQGQAWTRSPGACHLAEDLRSQARNAENSHVDVHRHS